MRPLLAALALGCSALAAPAADEITVLFTGETHAMLEPCLCPLRPEGGVARRATAVARARARGPVVLVDAGGWAAGGIYDEYTEGAGVDALRTAAAARAMAAMRYDAVALSDEELADGGAMARGLIARDALPLTSANLRRLDGTAPASKAYRIVEAGTWRVAIVGLTTHALDMLPASAAARVAVDPPLEAARRAVAAARAEKGIDAVVVLSPLGEEMSERIAREVDGIDLVVNAHRRTTSAPHFRARGTVVAQFDFQGRSLGRACLQRDARGSVSVTLAPPVKLGPEIPDDPEVKEIVDAAWRDIEADAASRVLVLELFKMARCPYTPPVEKTVAELARALGSRAEVRVTQLVHVDAAGKLTSFHGAGELEEARRQAAIFTFYPTKYFDYAAWREKYPAEEDWLRACRRLGMSAARLRGCILSGEADEILRRHARRVERLRVSGSPTLYFGGRKYEGDTSRAAVLRAACDMLPGGSAGLAVCKGLPRCFSDVECRRRGVVGECRDPGTPQARCVEHEALAVTLTVLEDSRAVHSAAGRVVESLRVFFPGLRERTVDYRSDEGSSLAAKYAIERLPAYIMDKRALKERKIDAVREALVPTKDALVLAPRLVGSHQDLTRPRREGRVDLFLASHSTVAAEALTEYLDLLEAEEAPPVRLRAAAWRNAEGKLAAQGGLAELESMMRAAAVVRRWPDRLVPYLRARLKRVGSSYWRDAATEAGIDPSTLRRAAEGDATVALLDADAQDLAELGAGGPVVVLVANQEVVPCASRAEIRHALAAARARADEASTPTPRPGEHDREAVALLVRALAAAPAPARARIAAGLRALSGEDFSIDVERWKMWLESREGPRKD